MESALGTQRDYFKNLYRQSDDPFRNWVNDYEERKRNIALNILREPQYGRIFEPGCGNGGLSKELSKRGRSVLSVDWSKEALLAAKDYCSAGNVEFREMNFPTETPLDVETGFDLMVVSELLYYYSKTDLERFFEVVPKILKPNGEILMIHWRGLSDHYPSNGDAVHRRFHQHSAVNVLETFEDPNFLISLGRWQ
ncbi:MAG: class I SAM-dependent methyltransferase [Proteobacteria bacterium]|nr:MAG: class I SAM-dependent methyltransferase [Pseudomonadota bacterium]